MARSPTRQPRRPRQPPSRVSCHRRCRFAPSRRVTLGDPAFEALPGAKADFGRLGGAVYQVEMPDKWNGRLVLFMHGYGELGPETSATAPDFRRYLIGQGLRGVSRASAARRSSPVVPSTRRLRSGTTLRVRTGPESHLSHGVFDGRRSDAHRYGAVPGPLRRHPRPLLRINGRPAAETATTSVVENRMLDLSLQ